MEQGCAFQRALVYFRGPRGFLEAIHARSLQSGRKQWGVAIFGVVHLLVAARLLV